jgi:hypothetical protein
MQWMVKRAAVLKGGAHVLAFSATNSYEFSVLRRLDPADLSKNVARGCELSRLDFNFVGDLSDYHLKPAPPGYAKALFERTLWRVEKYFVSLGTRCRY